MIPIHIARDTNLIPILISGLPRSVRPQSNVSGSSAAWVAMITHSELVKNHRTKALPSLKLYAKVLPSVSKY